MAEKTKVVEESKEVKFSEDELQSLQGLQTSYQEKQAALGQLSVQRILLNQQSEALEIRTTEVEQQNTKHHRIERRNFSNWTMIQFNLQLLILK